jgi:cation transport regulator
MPYTESDPPEAIKALPKDAQRIWVSAFNSAFRALEGSSKDREQRAHRIAWSAVKQKFQQNENGKWAEKRSAKRSFVAGDRIVVEMNEGLDGYSSLTHRAVDAGLGVYQNEGTDPETGAREAAALYFLQSSGWDVARAVTWARQWASVRNQSVKRVGIESDDDDGEDETLFVPFHEGRLRKSVEDPLHARKRIAFCVVYSPWEVDIHGDMATPDEIEKAAYGFMRKMARGEAAIGIQHQKWGGIGHVAETFIARSGDSDFNEGEWVVGVEFTEGAWQKVLNGELTGLSMGGHWNRIPVDETADLAATGTEG